MPAPRRSFSRDWGTKALALILALAAYVHVMSGQEREMAFRVPLEIAPLPPDLSFANEVPSEVRIRIRGSGKDLLKLRARRFSAEVRLESPRAGVLQRPILGSDVRLPPDVKVASVEVLEPAVLNLQIEPTASALLPVAVRLRGALPPDRSLLSYPVAEPRSVHTVGPSSIINAAESLLTVPLSLDQIRGSQDREVALRLTRGLSPEIRRVRVHIETDEKLVHRFESLPVELVPSQGDRLIWIRPDSADLVVTGAASNVESIDREQLRLVARIRRPATGPQRVGLQAVLPRLPSHRPLSIRCEPESVTVRLQ